MQVRKLYFPHHKPGFARLNHGSFGSAPLPVLEKANDFRMQYVRVKVGAVVVMRPTR